jgi:hypothetical protein
MAASFFRGTQLDQNVKFKDKDLELTKKMMFPADFDKPVDISKVSNRVPKYSLIKGSHRGDKKVG